MKIQSEEKTIAGKNKMKVDTLVPVFNLDLSNQDFLIIIYEGLSAAIANKFPATH